MDQTWAVLVDEDRVRQASFGMYQNMNNFIIGLLLAILAAPVSADDRAPLVDFINKAQLTTAERCAIDTLPHGPESVLHAEEQQRAAALKKEGCLCLATKFNQFRAQESNLDRMVSGEEAASLIQALKDACVGDSLRSYWKGVCDNPPHLSDGTLDPQFSSPSCRCAQAYVNSMSDAQLGALVKVTTDHYDARRAARINGLRPPAALPEELAQDAFMKQCIAQSASAANSILQR